jgi:hypothetical protein
MQQKFKVPIVVAVVRQKWDTENLFGSRRNLKHFEALNSTIKGKKTSPMPLLILLKVKICYLDCNNYSEECEMCCSKKGITAIE